MIKLIREAKEKAYLQSYQKQAFIEGVQLIEIKRFTGEDGAFNEIVRLDEQSRVVIPQELAGFQVRQLNHSLVVPGTIKAWHFHQRQDEIWFIHPRSQLIVGLLDIRSKSKTVKKTMKLALGNGRAHLLFIPRGVAHGLANLYSQPATMTYLVNNWFDGSDEWRLPFDFQVDRDFWAIEKG